MLSIIHKLQRRPEHVRKKMAIVWSAAATGLIVAFWLVSIVFSRGEPKTEIAQDAESGPFHALTEAVGTFTADIGDAFDQAAGVFSGFSEKLEEAKTDAETPVSE